VATAAALTVAGAAAGGSVRFLPPDARSVAGGLELALVNGGHAFLREFVLSLARPIEAAVSAAAGKWADLGDRKTLEAEAKRQAAILAKVLDEHEKQRIVAGNRAGMSLGDSMDAQRALPPLEATIAAARNNLRDLRVAAGSGVVVQFLEDTLGGNPGAASFDGHLLELRVLPSFLRRLTRLDPKSLDKQSITRTTAQWQSSARQGGKSVDACSGLSSLWVADTAEARAVWTDHKVVVSGLLDGMQVLRSSPGSNNDSHGATDSSSSVMADWRQSVVTLFNARIDGNTRLLRCGDDGFFRAARRELTSEAGGLEGAPPAAAELASMLLAKLSLNVALTRDPNTETVETGDMKVAAWLTGILIRSTAAWRSEARALVKSTWDKQGEPLSREVSGLISRLEKNGPMTRRELARSYGHSNVRLVDRAAEQAAGAGLVEVRGKTVMLTGRVSSSLSS